MIPKDYSEVKNVTGVFISKSNMELVVCGQPEDEEHNCDYMGCSSVSHVLYRMRYKEEAV